MRVDQQPIGRTLTHIYLIFFVLAGIANFAVSLLILRALSEAGVKVGFFEVRWQIHRHLKTYKELSKSSTGRPGALYYGYYVTLGLLLLCIVLILASLDS